MTDRPAGRAWNPPVKVATVAKLDSPRFARAATELFVENSGGDAALVFQEDPGTDEITAMRRRAGIWGALETVAVPGVPFALTGAAMSPNGEVLVTWQSYVNGKCGPRTCPRPSGFVVHVSEELRATAGWRDSGPISPAAPSLFVTRPIVDSSGRTTLYAVTTP